MKLYNQVCDPLQAQKIKELGISQESIFYTDRLANLYMGRGVDKLRLSDWTIHNGTTVGDFFSSYTVAELGVMLPETFGDNNSVIRSYRPNPDWVRGMKYPLNQWVCEFGDDDKIHEAAFQPTEAEARADMLIWLLENNHTTPEEVNTRLNNQ